MAYNLSRGVSGRLYGGRPVRNTVISAVVLLVVLIGGGLGYTYFFGPEGNMANVVPAEEIKPVVRERKPQPPEPESKASASVQSISTPIKAGSNASLSIKTVATSKCNVTVTYGTVVSTDSGLAPRVADEYGIVSWTWTVGPSVPPGTWPVKVLCTYNTRSAVVQDVIQVVP